MFFCCTDESDSSDNEVSRPPLITSSPHNNLRYDISSHYQSHNNLNNNNNFRTISQAKPYQSELHQSQKLYISTVKSENKNLKNFLIQRQSDYNLRYVALKNNIVRLKNQYIERQQQMNTITHRIHFIFGPPQNPISQKRLYFSTVHRPNPSKYY